MAMKIKLFDAETKGFGSIDLEDGKYVFEIVEIESSPAKSGRPRLQLRCKTVEGPVVGATAFDWWNLPEPQEKPDAFSKNFWRDVTKAWPFIYDEAKGELDEKALKGLQFRATVTHEEKKNKDGSGTGEMRMNLKSYRFQSKTGGTAAAAPATPAAPVEPEKPAKFAQP